MATIKTGENIVLLLLERDESCVVEFKPDGANAHSGSKRLGFHIDVINLPRVRTALSLRFPGDALYEALDTSGFVLLDDPNGADEAVFSFPDGQKLRLRRYRRVTDQGA